MKAQSRAFSLVVPQHEFIRVTLNGGNRVSWGGTSEEARRVEQNSDFMIKITMFLCSQQTKN